ncbi:hypothetical protein CEP52_016709 [Fusarium oligoseptatum]|uniref:HNH nuclease domain-containing protein n=1 Tax=Fusarium oligoseptatum TaxID=2604345 RepID=A0A428S1J5_9HYPO|nr:hypothetical protein CEP52_016709 [Fusarium oligoseptatum]
MSSAAVIPDMRARGWNVHILSGSTGFNFAGLYLHDGNDSIKWQHVLDELALCFDLPCSWPFAFAFGGYLNADADTPATTLICDADFDQFVPSPPPSQSPEARAIMRYHLVHHKPCAINNSSPFADHLKGLYQDPLVEKDPRYLPPKKPSTDTRITRLPLRRTVKAQKPSQSPKRKSGSVSPVRDFLGDPSDDSAMTAPPDMPITPEKARKTMDIFRASCLTAAVQCAVSARGRSWCPAPSFGPALQACHIVPQQHYHVYPDPDGLSDLADTDVFYSSSRLEEAWRNTWSADNGILLLCHLHDSFDQRLFSIHPDTLRIRAFVPYDVVLDYHGKKAQVPVNVDRGALRHHYEMCCIENMAAKAPLMELSSIASGTVSPFAAGAEVPSLPSPRLHDTYGGAASSVSQAAPGDPAKRRRPGQDDDVELETPSLVDDMSPEESPRVCKRLRMSRDAVNGGETPASYTGCLTDENSVEFLADVNWGLKKALLVPREHNGIEKPSELR